MIVSKFGGTSVGSAKNIKKVIKIVAGKNKKIAVIVSALGGVTNLLIKASELAVQGNKDYLNILKIVQEKHITAIDELLDYNNQNYCNDFVMQRLHKL